MLKQTGYRNQQKIKDEQINFLFRDLEKILEQYREAVEIRDKQIADAKKILLSAKQSYDKLAKENKSLKEYLTKITQQNQQIQQAAVTRNKIRKYKKVVLEEESEQETDTELEREQYGVERSTEPPPVKTKPRKKKRTTVGNNVFDYINNNAKRHRR